MKKQLTENQIEELKTGSHKIRSSAAFFLLVWVVQHYVECNLKHCEACDGLEAAYEHAVC